MMGLELLLIGGVIAYIAGWRPQLNPAKPAETGQSALDIVKARYARGEISGEEYQQMRRDLEG